MSMKPGATTSREASIRRFAGAPDEVADRRDAVVPDSDVRPEPRRAGAVDDPAAREEQVEGGGRVRDREAQDEQGREEDCLHFVPV